jgi:hypothetical protein
MNTIDFIPDIRQFRSARLCKRLVISYFDLDFHCSVFSHQQSILNQPVKRNNGLVHSLQPESTTEAGSMLALTSVWYPSLISCPPTLYVGHPSLAR